ncbi:MAG: hypothetical protein JWL62_3562 [Hyphomicrobiales bacterium]|nr:hypothetical protein [Hyphomicrobiales bacterium]
MKLPGIDALLASGGDERIVLDARGVNRYGQGLVPDMREWAFGSSTASTISADVRESVAGFHARLDAGIRERSPDRVYGREMERLREDFLSLCGFSDTSCPELVFAPSGTDLHLYAAHLMADASLLAITVEAPETGSGVADAIRGRHFATRTASGQSVTRGTPASADLHVKHIGVHARTPGGDLRPETQVEAEIDHHIARAAAAGQSVLLVVADISKTGLISPGLASVMRLRARWGERLHVMIDACQFRLSMRSLRAYVAQGFPVAVTGSKFLGGPAFSGVLLCPPSLAKIWRHRELPDALSAYGTCAEWPQGWAGRRAMRGTTNFGLLLRWRAALHELQAFHALPEATIRHVTRTFAAAIEERLRLSRLLEPLPTRPLDRACLLACGGWDDHATIFPFLLQEAASTEQVYRELAKGAGGAAPVRLGQPVPVGQREGVPISALRLCFSARLAVEAARSPLSLQAVVNRALGALDETARLADEIRPARALSRVS